MPMHDLTGVAPGIYHDLHNTWILHLKESINDGLYVPVKAYVESIEVGNKLSTCLYS